MIRKISWFLLAFTIALTPSYSQIPPTIPTEQFGNYLDSLPTASSVGPADYFYLRQGGDSKRVSGSLIPSLTSPETITGLWNFATGVQVPTQTLGDNTPNAASDAFVQSALGALIIASMPAFTTVCNPTGVTAPGTACAAVTAQAPLSINTTTNILSLLGIYTSNNLFYGFNAGNATGTGVNNVALGFAALAAYTSGGNNTAIGGNALAASTTGSQNMALGYNAMAGLKTGVNNVGIGYQAMLVAGAVSAANGNTGIGQQALFGLTSGAINTAVGAQACNSITIGQFNTCIGALNSTGSHSITTGSNNTVICSYTTGLSLGITTGSNNVILGCPTGLATNSAGKLVFADGAGNIRADYGNATAGGWTFSGPFASTTTLQGKLIYSVSGTPLPTCNGAAEGTHAGVSDATGPTYLANYVSGGAVHAPVYCNGTNWVTN